MEAATLKIKTVIDNSGIKEGLPGIKKKLKEVSEKLKLGEMGKKVGGFLKTALSGVAKALGGILKVVGKIGLLFAGVFAGGIISNAFKKALDDSETLRGNLHYLLAMVQTGIQNIIIKMLPAIKRLLEGIINLIWTILNYINYLTKAWFNLDLFEGASDTFAKNMKKAAGSAKQVKKELDLAPFDEINKLSDNSGGGSGAGGASYGTPDLDKLGEVKIPGWLEWIKNHGEDIAKILGDIALGFGLIKLGVEPLKALGIVLIFDGLLDAIKGIRDYIDDPSWENFGKTIGGIGKSLVGLGLLTGNWVLVLVGGTAWAASEVIKNWDKIQKKSEETFNTLEEGSDEVRDKYGNVIGDVYDAIVRWGKRGWEKINEYVTGLKDTFNGIIEFFKNIFKGDWDKVWDSLKETASGLFKVVEGGADNTWGFVRGLGEEAGTFLRTKVIEPAGKLMGTAWDNLKRGAGLAWDGVKKAFSTTADFFKNTFKKAWEGVKAVFSVGGKIFDGIKDGIVKAFSTVVNAIINGINKVVKIPFDGLNSALKKIKKIDILGQKPFNFISTISVPQIPTIKLAKGGIINNPGRGVPLGSNIIGGEAGPEAVIPLNDETMNRLGAAIARNMVINANITNSMNGRVISRELQKIANDSDFAFNR
jgi:hypothetical protein